MILVAPISRWSWLVPLFLLALPACASSPQDPESVLHAYARALEEGRADDAYRMLSDEARRGLSPEAFRRMRNYATHHNRKLVDVAQQITAAEETFQALDGQS